MNRHDEIAGYAWAADHPDTVSHSGPRGFIYMGNLWWEGFYLFRDPVRSKFGINGDMFLNPKTNTTWTIREDGKMWPNVKGPKHKLP